MAGCGKGDNWKELMHEGNASSGSTGGTPPRVRVLRLVALLGAAAALATAVALVYATRVVRDQDRPTEAAAPTVCPLGLMVTEVEGIVVVTEDQSEPGPDTCDMDPNLAARWETEATVERPLLKLDCTIIYPTAYSGPRVQGRVPVGQSRCGATDDRLTPGP